MMYSESMNSCHGCSAWFSMSNLWISFAVQCIIHFWLRCLDLNSWFYIDGCFQFDSIDLLNSSMHAWTSNLFVCSDFPDVCWNHVLHHYVQLDFICELDHPCTNPFYAWGSSVDVHSCTVVSSENNLRWTYICHSRCDSLWNEIVLIKVPSQY